MDKIVADLQDYARPISPEREVVAVSTLAEDVIASLPYSDHVEIVTDFNDCSLPCARSVAGSRNMPSLLSVCG